MKRILLITLLVAIGVIAISAIAGATFAPLTLPPFLRWMTGSETAEVTLFFTPGEAGAPSAPTNFKAVACDNNTVQLTWEMGTGAAKTLILGKMNTYPTDNLDSYIVFYGTGTEYVDQAIHWDHMLGTMYYRAWSDNGTGGLSENYSEDNVENPFMVTIANLLSAYIHFIPLFLIVGMLALFNALAFWQRHIFLYIMVAIGDIVFGLYYAWQIDPFTDSSAIYTVTWVIGILVVILGFFCLFRATMKIITERR